jgi:23S rRNA (uridine2552-2'-O)-methyltransferase
MDEQYHLFPRVSKNIENTIHRQRFFVADLGCSPGGWSQASLELLGTPRGDTYEDSDIYSSDDDIPIPQVVGVDIISTEPLPGARFIQGDFLDLSVQRQLRLILGDENAQLDLILSDMAPNLSGNRTADIEASLQLCRSVLEFAKINLCPSQGKDSKSGSLV